MSSNSMSEKSSASMLLSPCLFEQRIFQKNVMSFDICLFCRPLYLISVGDPEYATTHFYRVHVTLSCYTFMVALGKEKKRFLSLGRQLIVHVHATKLFMPFPCYSNFHLLIV